MYSIPLKDNSKEIDLVVIRSLLALAGFAAFFYRANSYAILNIAIAIILFAVAFGVKLILEGLRLNKLLLLSSAGLLLFAATHAVMFSLLLIAFGMAASFIYKKPVVLLSAEKVALKSSKGTTNYGWEEFDNIVLKDNLLTLDFKNNKLLQLDTDFISNKSNEKEVNNFCSDCLQKCNNAGIEPL